MKTLTKYITESINQQYLNKLNLTGIPQSSNDELGKPQEKFVIDKLNEAYPEYKWISTKEYYDKSYDSKKDLVDGDIVGLENDKVKFFLDVKVSKNTNKKYVGVISLNSILNFGDEHHYYLCKSKEIKDLFNKTEKCLKVTSNNNRNKTVQKDLDKYLNKFIDQTENVSYEDYMPSYLFNK